MVAAYTLAGGGRLLPASAVRPTFGRARHPTGWLCAGVVACRGWRNEEHGFDALDNNSTRSTCPPATTFAAATGSSAPPEVDTTSGMVATIHATETASIATRVLILMEISWKPTASGVGGMER